MGRCRNSNDVFSLQVEPRVQSFDLKTLERVESIDGKCYEGLCEWLQDVLECETLDYGLVSMWC